MPLVSSQIAESADPVFVFDTDTARIVDANAAASSLYGYHPAELIGLRLEALRPSEDAVEAAALVREMGRHAEPVEQHGVLHARRDGGYLEVDLRAEVVPGSQGRLRRIVVRDVTAERARQRAMRRHSLLFHAISDAVLMTDAAGRITDWNPAAEVAFGWRRDEVLGRTMTFLHPHGTGERRVREILGAIQERDRWAGALEAVRRDRSVRLFDVQVFAVRDDRGRLWSTIAVHRDVTEQVDEQAALQESERRFRLLAEQLPHIVWIAGPAGEVEYYNRRLATLSPIESPDDASAARVRPTVHPDDAARTREAWRDAVETGEPYEIEHRLQSADGEFRWHVTRGTPLVDDGGRVVRWYGSTTDVHDRRLSEESIREQEAHFRGMFENAHDAIVLFDPDTGQIQDANPAAESLYGYPRDALRSVSMLDLCDDSAGTETKLSDLFRDGGGEPVELVQRSRDGRVFRVEVNAARMQSSAGDVVLAIMRDVTERRELERQLRQAQKMEAIGRLAGGLAHDFNNLTTAIRGFAALLQDELEVEGTAAEALREIDRAAERASGLTRQLLAYTRQQVLRPRTVDLNEAIGSARRLLQRLIGEDIELVAHLDPDTAPVRADPGQLQQVVMNLAINARDAMPDGGTLTFETRTIEADEAFVEDHRPMEPGRYVELRLTDTGHGMDPDVRQQIFEPFFTTKGVGEGTGLGLSTVYGIVKQSGGFIWVDSEPGRGTTFTIHFPPTEPAGPAAEVDADPGPPDGDAEPPANDVLSRDEQRTILLVEDEDGVRKLTRRVLERNGYRILEASNGQEGLDIAWSAREPIHLLLTDMIMPRMSGKELARAVGSRFPEIPVLFMSGYTGEALHQRGELDGVETVLEKPFRPAELIRAVREMLEVPTLADQRS